ncbi:hypothetical protein ABPG74_011600 [Tetrahymena malaccensis]
MFIFLIILQFSFTLIKTSYENNQRVLSVQSIVENQEQEGCQYCLFCDKGYCIQCQEDFIFDEEKQVCVSMCEEDMYFDIYNTRKCQSQCRNFYEYEDNLHRVCKQVRDCSLFMQIGYEYPDLIQDNFIIDEDLNLMVSSDFYNINLFDLATGVQISKLPIQQGIRHLAYNQNEKELLLLKQNGDVFLYDIKSVSLKKQYLKRKNEKNERVKQKSIIILDKNLLLMFGVERNVYLFNYQTQKIEQEFKTGRYTEIIMFDVFRISEANFESSSDFYFSNLLNQNVYFTIETDQNLDYFINILDNDDTNYFLLNQSKLAQIQVFLKINLLILEDSILYIFQVQSLSFPIDQRFQIQQVLQKFINFSVSEDNQRIFLLDNQNRIFILDSKLQFLSSIDLSQSPPIILIHAKLFNTIFIIDQSNKLSLFIQEEQSNVTFQKISDLDLKIQSKFKILSACLQSPNIYIIGKGVIQLQFRQAQDDASYLQIKNQISQNINFNYNITSENTEISLNEYNQFIFNYDMSNLTAFPYIQIYDFIQKSHIKTLDLKKFIIQTNELQKIVFVFQLEQNTIIVLSNQVIINYDNSLMQVVQSINFYEQEQIKFKQAISVQEKKSLLFYDENTIISYRLQITQNQIYFLFKGKKYEQSQEERQIFSVQIILAINQGNKLIIFNRNSLVVKVLDFENLTEDSKIIDENINIQVQNAKLNKEENILLASSKSGENVFYTVNKQKVTINTQKDMILKDFWFLEEKIVLALCQFNQNININQQTRIRTQIQFWVLDVSSDGKISLKIFESFNTRMAKQAYFSENAQLLYGIDDCEGCNYIQQMKIYKTQSKDQNISPYRVEQLYTDNLDSSHPVSIIYNEKFDNFIVNKLHSGVEINQNMNNNIYEKFSSLKHNEAISLAKIEEIEQLLFIVFKFVLEVWSLVDSSHIDKQFNEEINNIFYYKEFNLIAVQFKNESKIAFWYYKINKVYIQDFRQAVKDFFIQFQNLFVFFDNQKYFDVCVDIRLSENMRCSQFLLHRKPIQSFKFDGTGILYTCSENQIISWEISQNSFEYRILQIYETEQNLTSINKFYIDSAFQRIFIQSPTTLVAYNFQAQLESILHVITKFEDESSQGLEFGDTIIVKWSKNYFRIYDRYSLQYLDKQVYDQISQLIILNQPKIIAVLLGQESANQGSIMKFNYEQFFNLRSIEGDLFDGKINLQKIWYDNDSNRLVGIEKSGNILFWEQENGKREIREDQVLRLTSEFDGTDIPFQNLVVDKIHNNIIAYNKEHIFSIEGSAYWSRGGLYTQIPDLELSSVDNQDLDRDPEYEKPYFYDKNMKQFIFLDGFNNIIMMKENKQYFMIRSNYKYRKFIQINSFMLAAYDQEDLHLLSIYQQSIQIIAFLHNQRIINCRQDSSSKIKLHSQNLQQYIVCFNRERQVIQYFFQCTSENLCSITPQTIYQHPTMRIMEIRLIFPYIITYDISGLVYIYKQEIIDHSSSNYLKGTIVDQHQLRQPIVYSQANFKNGQLVMQSQKEILVINIKDNEIQTYHIKKLYPIQFIYSDFEFERLFIQQKNIKILNVYHINYENKYEETLTQKVQLTSLQGNSLINTSKHVLIYNGFQINLYERKSLQILDYYKSPRQSKYIYSIKIINDEIFVTIERFGIRIFYLTNLSNSYLSQIKFFKALKIDSPLLISRAYENNIIYLIGLSSTSFFNFTISIDHSQICKYAFPPLANNYQLLYYTEHLETTQKQLLDSTQSLKYNFLISFFPNQDNKQLSYINRFSNQSQETSIIYQSSSNQSVLLLNPHLFMIYSQKVLVLQNIVLKIDRNEMPYQQGKLTIKFNSQIEKIKLYNVTILGGEQIENFQIIFKDMEKVLMSNITISNTNLLNSDLFYFQNCEKVEINDLKIDEVTAINSTIISTLNINQMMVLDQIQIKNVFTDKNLFYLTVINASSIKNIFIENIYLIKNYLSQLDRQKANYYIIEVEAVKLSIQIENLLATQVADIGIFKYTNTYLGENYDQIVYKDQIIIQNVTMKHLKSDLSNSFFSLSGHAVSINLFNTYNLVCKSCYGTSLQIKNYVLLTISNSKFTESAGYIGGAIFSDPTNSYSKTSFYLTKSQFLRNTATQYGGAIFLSQLNLLKVENITFESNTAPIGGAFRYFTNSRPQFPDNFAQQVSFYNNTAAIFGNNYCSYPHKMKIEKISNEDEDYDLKEIILSQIGAENIKQKQEIETYIIKNNLDVLQIFEIFNIRSGSLLGLNVTLYDELNQLIKLPQNLDLYGTELSSELEQYEIQFSSSNYNLVIDKKLNYPLIPPTFTQNNEQQQQQYNYYYLIQDTAVIGQPLGYDYIVMEVPFIFNYFSQNANLQTENNYENDKQILFKVNFRNCNQGEILQKSNQYTLSCHRCEDNSYSLVTYEKAQKFSDLQAMQQEIKCQRCPYFAESCERNRIHLRDNYWRAANDSDVITFCENKPENCIAANENMQYCKEGNIGPLCEECDINGQLWGQSYTRQGDYSCSPCSGNTNPIVKQIFLYLGILVYLAFSIVFFLQIYIQTAKTYYLRQLGIVSLGNSSLNHRSSIYAKQMLHYFQVMSVIQVLDYKMPIQITLVPNSLGSPIQNMNGAIDCIFRYGNIPQVYIRVIVSLLIPIIFKCITYLFIKLLLKLMNIKIKKQKIQMVVIFSIIFFQPNVVNFFVSVISCRKIGNINYVNADLTQICYSQQHLQYTYYLVLPSLFIWSLFPLIILKGLYNCKNKLNFITTQYKYGFLYMEYRDNCYYWEFVRLYVKLIIFLTINMFKSQPNVSYIFVASYLIIYAYYILKLNPFQNNFLNTLDFKTVVVLLVCIFFNIIYKNTTSDVIKDIVSISQIAISYGFLLLLAFYMIKQKIKELKKYLLKKFVNWKEKYPNFLPECCKKINLEDSTMRVNVNWLRFKRKVYRSIQIKKNMDTLNEINLNTQQIEQTQKDNQQIDPNQSCKVALQMKQLDLFLQNDKNMPVSLLNFGMNSAKNKKNEKTLNKMEYNTQNSKEQIGQKEIELNNIETTSSRVFPNFKTKPTLVHIDLNKINTSQTFKLNQIYSDINFSTPVNHFNNPEESPFDNTVAPFPLGFQDENIQLHKKKPKVRQIQEQVIQEISCTVSKQINESQLNKLMSEQNVARSISLSSNSKSISQSQIDEMSYSQNKDNKDSKQKESTCSSNKQQKIPLFGSIKNVFSKIKK